MTPRYCLILFFAASLVAGTPPQKHAKRRPAETAQMQPGPERIAEIQAALKAHGHEPGTTWEETQEVCRKIADEHLWQTDHAPDVRVLILIGLGGLHSDPAVAQMKGGRLDQDQREEAARQSQSVARPVENPSGRMASSRAAAATRLSANTSVEANGKSQAPIGNKNTRKKQIKKSRPKPAQAATLAPAAPERSAT
jgi:hypothetical protein